MMNMEIFLEHHHPRHLYVPSLLFGSMVVSYGASGEAVGTPLALLAAISLGSLAILPFASASVLRVNLR